MKIILSNYRYFMSGGPESYLFRIQDMLRAHGHEAIPFSVRSGRNLPNDFEEHFLSPIGNGDETYFREYKKDFRTLSKVVERQLYSPEAFFKARHFAKWTGADLVYSLQYLNKMSPAVPDGFKAAGLPVVVRISDFGLVCPQAHFFDGASACTLCIHGNFLHAIQKKCVMNSSLGSALKAASLTLSRLLGCQARIDAFVFPSQFTLERFAEAGFPREKLHCIPTAVTLDEVSSDNSAGAYFLYFGRMTQEKGVHDLLQAYRAVSGDKPKLLVVGAVPDTAYARQLMDEYSEVEFHPFVSKPEIEKFVRGALCVVIPSVWYDNLPNVLLETYAYGKPVIAPAHGCFPDAVRDGETGMLYDPGSPAALTERLVWAMNNPGAMTAMGKHARHRAETEFSAAAHYEKLIRIFASVLKNRG